MIFAREDDDAMQLGIEVKADPTYILSAWTTEDVGMEFDRISGESPELGLKTWREMDATQAGLIVEATERALHQEKAFLPMREALRQVVRDAVHVPVNGDFADDEGDGE